MWLKATVRSLAVVTLLSGSLVLPPAVSAPAGEGHDGKSGQEKKQGGVRVDDLPKPIPDFMKALQRAGNSAGKGISKGASEGAQAVKKVIKGSKDEKK